jgi:3-oxoacyl-[acyl-carrier protein] reductase
MRRALVTGGSGAIGGAICRRLAADGLDVLVHANRNADAAQAVVRGIVDAGGRASATVFDVTDRESTSAALERHLAEGPVQVVVHNAGVHDDAVFPAMRAEQWHRVLAVGLDGFFHVTQPLLLPMLRTRWGRIVSVTSVAGLVGNRGQVNYAAAKGGLHAATKSLALEVATRGVTVNAVAPGIVDTPMSRDAFDRAAIERIVPMKRAGRADEVADLVGFLCSERAAYITAQVISINGGLA